MKIDLNAPSNGNSYTIRLNKATIEIDHDHNISIVRLDGTTVYVTSSGIEVKPSKLAIEEGAARSIFLNLNVKAQA